MKKFLIAVDPDTKQLFIVHREFPACLIEVVPEMPVKLVVQELYQDIDIEELKKLPFLEEAKSFWKKNAANVNSQN